MRVLPVVAALRISFQSFAGVNLRTTILPHSVAKRKGLSHKARELVSVLLDTK
jgi:hypothetical protein